MIFTETKLRGAFLIELDKKEDERGFFARAWCRNEFREHGLVDDFVQVNLSYNRRKGTLRGMHFQAEPHAEVKLMRCIRGAIFNAIVDLRPTSPTFRQWFGTELTAQNRRMLYVPKGFANGYLALEDESEVLYSVSSFYHPESEGGLRWDDPDIGIQWPEVGPLIISEKDRNWPVPSLALARASAGSARA